ncbi:MAG: hypothetical protein ACLTZU_12750 [Odoribacter splanchnicus]
MTLNFSPGCGGQKNPFYRNLPKYRNLDQVLNKLELTTHIRFVQDGRAIEVFAE